MALALGILSAVLWRKAYGRGGGGTGGNRLMNKRLGAPSAPRGSKKNPSPPKGGPLSTREAGRPQREEGEVRRGSFSVKNPLRG